MIRPRKGKCVNKLRIWVGKTGRETRKVVMQSGSKDINVKAEIKVGKEKGEPGRT